MWLCKCSLMMADDTTLTFSTSGDTFVIISRARGWWVVQRDPTGSGIVDSDTSKQGWVPAGCLLETKIPVAVAIAEAHAISPGSRPPTPDSTHKTPILPLNIVSTSFPGYALMDYKKKGEEELDLLKDDSLRVFKRYNHWSYVSPKHLLSISRLRPVPSIGSERRRRRSWLGPGESALMAFI